VDALAKLRVERAPPGRLRTSVSLVHGHEKVPTYGHQEVPTPAVTLPSATLLDADTEGVGDERRRGRHVKSARERFDIITTYEEVGSYRATAALCCTTHKTVRRIV